MRHFLDVLLDRPPRQGETPETPTHPTGTEETDPLSPGLSFLDDLFAFLGWVAFAYVVMFLLTAFATGGGGYPW